MELFAGIPVADLERAKDWYTGLLGDEPSFLPNDQEAVWTLEDRRHVYVVVDQKRAGGGLVTLLVEDLETRIEQIAGRGIQPATDETYSNGVRKVTYEDADGNEVGFGGGPQEA